MFDSDNLYFINTPSEIQNEVFNFIVERLNQMNIPSSKNVYAMMTSIVNLNEKYFFRCYLRDNGDKSPFNAPDFLIFLS